MAMLSDLMRSDKPPVLLKLRSSAGLIVTTAAFAVLTVRLSHCLMYNW